jgi:hypothetical protein
VLQRYRIQDTGYRIQDTYRIQNTGMLADTYV